MEAEYLDFIIKVPDAPSPVTPAARLPPPPPPPLPTPLATRAVSKASVVNMHSRTYIPHAKIKEKKQIFGRHHLKKKTTKLKIKLNYKKIPEHTSDLPPPSRYAWQTSVRVCVLLPL
jgi:hypothetical protein